MTTELEWKNPPAPKPRRVDEVAAQLRSRPGEWALIHSGPFQLISWWSPLVNSTGYELKHVPINRDQYLGPRETYARYVGQPSRPDPGGD